MKTLFPKFSTSKMSDLILFTDSFPYGTGENFLETEVSYLSNEFDLIHIFPLFYGNSKNARKLPQNISYSRPFVKFHHKKNKLLLLISGIFNFAPWKFSFKELISKKVYKNKSWLNSWGVSTLLIRSILRPKNKRTIQSRIKPNSILYYYWGDRSSGILPYISSRCKNIQVVRFHGSDLYEYINDGYIPYRAQLLNKIDRAVFISRMGQEYLINKYSNIKFNNSLFRLGVNKVGEANPSTDGIFRIVSCSNVIALKRINIILEALSYLDFKVEWTHIGDGELLDEIKNNSRHQSSEYLKCLFKGHLSNKDVYSYYENNPVDVFINVSASEGVPVSIMEAISFGIPVIATDVGGTSEIVSDSYGILVDKNISPRSLSDVIANFRNESPAKITMRRNNAVKFWNDYYNAESNYKDFTRFLKSIPVSS